MDHTPLPVYPTPSLFHPALNNHSFEEYSNLQLYPSSWSFARKVTPKTAPTVSPLHPDVNMLPTLINDVKLFVDVLCFDKNVPVYFLT